MNDYITKSELYHYIDILRTKNNSLTYVDSPIDLIKICHCIENIDVILQHFNSKSLWGLAFKGDKQNTIVINDNKSHPEKQFICGHELIHILKHPINELGYQCFENPMNQQNRILEWQANEGSAEILIPYRIFLNDVKDNLPLLKKNFGVIEFRHKMSEKFGVTPHVIECRINSLKYEIAQYLTGTNISNIEIISAKTQRERGLNIKSLNEIENQRLSNIWYPAKIND